MRALSFRQVEDKVGFKETRLRELIAEGLFPVPTKFSKRKSFFLEEEIDRWIADRFAERTGTKKAKV